MLVRASEERLQLSVKSACVEGAPGTAAPGQRTNDDPPIPSGEAAPGESLSQESRSSIIDSQGPLSETDRSRSALAAASAQSAPFRPLRP